MKVNVTFVVVVLALGLVDAARRRVRSTTATLETTTPASSVDRQLAFAEQPEEIETLWDNFDIQKLDGHSDVWKNATVNHDEGNLGRQYPGLPSNPGDTNELPSPISPPPQPILPPQKPPPGCQGPRGQYPSPKSCANYLNCWDDVVIEQTCPDGLLFNDIAGYCDFAFNVNCGDRPPATPKPPLPPGSKQCPDPNGRYRSSTNCSEFYVCVAGRPTKFSCLRSLVYNDILNVCDYPYNVDCKGAATPKPPKPTQPSQTPTQPSQPSPTNPPQPPTRPPQPSTRPPQPPTRPPQPPTRPSQPPTRPPQPPTYPSQPPVYPPQPPTYPPQPPTNPPQPPIYPQPYPPPSPSYPGNPWLNKAETDPWHQRPQASQLEINKEKREQEAISTDNQLLLLGNRPTPISETELVNPWTLFQVIPSELANTTCNNGDVHRLNDACTNVVVCRNNKPQMVRCSTGFSYDKPSDSCRPLSIAKC
ncbi:uncharacterized protein LOC126854422 [Cataglyphis hispanica]|uniref:uncharacterized protein LOC126854422 n=1 Tax=Cataglyphis hispanica TaxID=1086592 RepID=UPI0021802489|nr:uncharacterized protein LOC126854422 [Cataglyphis hispanica]